MPFPKKKIVALLKRSDVASTADEKGALLEDAIELVFSAIPGMELSQRDVVSAFQNEEIDLAFWNEKAVPVTRELPGVVLIECKNWKTPTGSPQVTAFVDKLRNRSCPTGILLAARGITGDIAERTAAQQSIVNALRDGIRVLVITREEVESLSSVSGLLDLIKVKLLMLVATGSSL